MSASWQSRNLITQGYALAPDEERALALGLRFPTGACWLLVVTALALDSAILMGALVPVGIVAGWGPRHPFDVFWNVVVRRVVGGPAVPPTPRRRRHAFKLGAAWVALLAALLATGHHVAAVAAAAPLLAVCAVVTVTNWCLPSTLLCAWEKRAVRRES